MSLCINLFCMSDNFLRKKKKKNPQIGRLQIPRVLQDLKNASVK